MRCKTCGAEVSPGTSTCPECGTPLSRPGSAEPIKVISAASDSAMAPVPLRQRRRTPGERRTSLLVGIAGLVVGVFGIGVAALSLAPRLYEAVAGQRGTSEAASTQPAEPDEGQKGEPVASGVAAPQAIERLSSQDSAPAQAQERQPETGSLTKEGLQRTWKGTYVGASQASESGTISRTVTISIQELDDDGHVEAICRIGVDDLGAGSTNASYYVTGTVDWETGWLELDGSSWIDSGDLARMRHFEGKIDAEDGTITGTTSELDGSQKVTLTMKAQ